MKLSSHYAKILRVVLKRDIATSDGWPSAVQHYLDSLTEGYANESGERRNSQRQDMEICAVIRLQKKGNEVLYLPAKIKNMSASGVMVELEDKGHIMVSSMDSIEQFLVCFEVPGEKELVTVECLPRRLEIAELVGVGAEFAELEAAPHKYVM